MALSSASGSVSFAWGMHEQQIISELLSGSMSSTPMHTSYICKCLRLPSKLTTHDRPRPQCSLVV